MAGYRASRIQRAATTLPLASVTLRSMRLARVWLWVAISAARPDWRTSAYIVALRRLEKAYKERGIFP